MNDIKEVLQLAEQKGYLHYFLEPDDADTYSGHIIYIELCLIQKWLRDTFKIAVFVQRGSFGHYGYTIFKNIERDNKKDAIERTSFSHMSPTYEQSLQEGIKEALQLI